MTIHLPPSVNTIITRMNSCGFEAYVVGGCVRDILMGKPPHDWDICTSALPDEIKNCFSSYRLIETGIKHGTVTVMIGDEPFEITTYRIDGDYGDRRHPDNVTFTRSLREDLSRRDFTANALAYNEKDGVIDYYGGAEDINHKIIRCVGNPDIRFGEDALRIMRALRFSSVLGFSIDSETSESIHKNKNLLENVSAERIREELCKMLSGIDIRRVMTDYSDVIAGIIPEFLPCIGFDQNNRFHIYDVYGHIAAALDNYKGGDIVTRLTLFFHDVGKPRTYTENTRGGHFYGHEKVSADMTDAIMRRLRFDNETRYKTSELVLFHDAQIAPSNKSVRRWLNKLGIEQFLRLLDVKKADIIAHSNIGLSEKLDGFDKIKEIYADITAKSQCFSLRDLAVNGDDLKKAGIPEGKKIGETLDALLNKVIDGELENDKKTLLESVKYKN